MTILGVSGSGLDNGAGLNRTLAPGLSQSTPASGGGSAPVNTVAPVATGQVSNMPVAGLKLDYTPGTYTGATSQSAELYRDGVATGVTTFPYTRLLTDEGKTLKIRETAVNAYGSTSVDTATETVISGVKVGYNPTDTSTITQTAGLVSQLNDFTGNGKNATQATGASQPITGSRTLNNLNGIDFNGVVQAMDMPDDTYPYSAGTDFLVYIADDGNRNAIIGNSAVSPSNGRRYQLNFECNYGNSNLANSVTTGVGVVQMSTIDGASTGTQTQTLRTNNTDNSNTTSTRGTGVSAGMGMGGLQDGTSNFFNGALFFHVSFGRVLTNAEKNIIGSCLTTYFAQTAWANV